MVSSSTYTTETVAQWEHWLWIRYWTHGANRALELARDQYNHLLDVTDRQNLETAYRRVYLIQIEARATG